MRAKTILIFLFVMTTIHAQNNYKLLIAENRYDEAISILTDSLSLHPESHEFNYYISIAYKGNNNISRAFDYAVKASELEPGNKLYLLNVGDLYFGNHRNTAAEGYYKRVLKLDSVNNSALKNLGLIAKREKRFNEATSYFITLCVIDSLTAWNFKQAGISFANSGNIERSLEYLKRGEALSTGDVEMYTLISRVFLSRSELDSAMFYVERGLTFAPDNYELLDLKGTIAFKQRDMSKTINVYTILLGRGDSSFTTYKRLAYANYFIASTTISKHPDVIKLKYSDAIKYFNLAYEKDTTDANIPVYTGLSYFALENYDSAKICFTRALDILSPALIGETWTYLGSVYEKEGNYSSAIDCLSRAKKEAPENKSIIFRLAALYDSYYKDRTVPLMYYRKYLNETDSSQKALVEYAASRIEKLTEEVHFMH